MYIVRHGESEANVANIYDVNPPLTSKGRKQAQKIAKKLKKVTFDIAFSSHLDRAKETAEIIAAEHNLVLLIKETLREREAGVLNGKSVIKAREELQERYAMRRNLPYDEWKTMTIAEGYETDEQLMGRFITTLREIAIAYPGKTVLIGSHLGIMKTLLVHLGFTTYNQIAGDAFENTGYIKLKTDGVDFFIEETKGLKKA